MRVDELTVEVKAQLDVSRSTAEACLKLVELYSNSHPETRIVATKQKDGSLSYNFEEVQNG